jgi:alpha-tubulin suppressor-like RCC1 family protein
MPRYLSSESTSTNGTSSGTGSSSITPVSLGGTGANTATSALLNLGATTFGIQILSSVDAAAVNTLLGNTGSSGSTSSGGASQTDLNTEINNRISGDNALNASLTTVSTIANAALPSAAYTAADVFAKVKTLDGSGSGLDADTVRGFIPVQQGTGIGQLPNVVKVGWDGAQLKVTVDATDLGGIALKSDLTKVINPSKITYLSESGYDVAAMIMDGKLYTTSGAQTDGYGASTTGRTGFQAPSFNLFQGVNNFKEAYIPNTSGIRKVGGFLSRIAFALMNDGSLYTWGYNDHGECGLGHVNQVNTPTLAAVGVVDAFIHASCGGYDITYNHFVILKNDGYLYGTGYNGNGQLGLGDTTNRTSFTLMSWAGTNPKNVFVLGNNAGCVIVLTSDGRIKVAGYNASGQLGNGNNSNQLTGVDVTNAWAGVASGVLAIKASGGFGYYDTAANYSCTLVMMITLPNNTNIVKSSGNNSWSSLGNGGTASTNVPVSVLNSTNVVDIATFGGGPLTCQMLKSDGTVWAWGHNAYGNVGNGNTTNVTTPIQILSNAKTLLSDGQTSHTYSYHSQSAILKTDGTLWMNGENSSGYCAIGNANTTIVSPTQVALPPDDSSVELLGHFTTHSYGRIFYCVTTKGNLYAWGDGDHGGIDGAALRYTCFPEIMNLPRRNT